MNIAAIIIWWNYVPPTKRVLVLTCAAVLAYAISEFMIYSEVKKNVGIDLYLLVRGFGAFIVSTVIIICMAYINKTPIPKIDLFNYKILLTSVSFSLTLIFMALAFKVANPQTFFYIIFSFHPLILYWISNDGSGRVPIKPILLPAITLITGALVFTFAEIKINHDEGNFALLSPTTFVLATLSLLAAYTFSMTNLLSDRAKKSEQKSLSEDNLTASAQIKMINSIHLMVISVALSFLWMAYISLFDTNFASPSFWYNHEGNGNISIFLLFSASIISGIANILLLQAFSIRPEGASQDSSPYATMISSLDLSIIVVIFVLEISFRSLYENATSWHYLGVLIVTLGAIWCAKEADKLTDA